jgi:hypothetical protein
VSLSEEVALSKWLALEQLTACDVPAAKGCAQNVLVRPLVIKQQQLAYLLKM